MNDGYRCECTSGFTGTTCADVDYCATSPCQNGGTCVNEADGYRCGFVLLVSLDLHVQMWMNVLGIRVDLAELVWMVLDPSPVTALKITVDQLVS